MATEPGLMLELRRTLAAPPSTVFELFADADQLARWWGPAGFSTPSLDFEARVGRDYRIEMHPPEGAAFYLAGEFRAVEPPNRLVYTFRWEDPDPDDVETLVDLSFRPAGEATEVALSQGPFKTEGRRALHRGGWSDGFDKLAKLLA
jgi:uncharacterized protein YndB with AHSA1/START domain